MSKHFQQLWWTHGPFMLVLLLLLPVFVLDTIQLSHRFVGPIYRLRQTIRSAAQSGDTPVLKFREVDFWQGMAEDFNQMIERLGEKESTPVAQETIETAEPVEACS